MTEAAGVRRTGGASRAGVSRAIRRAFLAGIIPFALGAQTVRGIVVQPDSITRAAGVIVVATDLRGDVVARALTGSAGSFELRFPVPGSYHLRALRVGFRPTVMPDVSVPPSGTEGVRIVLAAEAVTLSAVTVRSDNVCGSTNDAGRVVAQLWEEARVALTATELTADAGALDVEWQAFQFLMDKNATRARDQSVLRRRGATERPFYSVGAEALARNGYVVEDGNDLLYRAPDAAALLSNEFAATHCFQVEPPSAERAQWIGVAFRPTPSRNFVRDIAGTLWLDRATAELRMLEFRYTNLPQEATHPAIGGFVEYIRVATGHWLVARWAIRTPAMVIRSVGGGSIPGGGRDTRPVMAAIGVTGGELVRALSGEVTLYQADQGTLAAEGSIAVVPARASACGAALRPGVTLRGTVAKAGAVAGGAVVSVSWPAVTGRPATKLSGVADARGTFAIPCVARGVPLTVTATAGEERSDPVTVGPAGGRELVVNITIKPALDR